MRVIEEHYFVKRKKKVYLRNNRERIQVYGTSKRAKFIAPSKSD